MTLGVRLHLFSEDGSSLQARAAELRRQLLEWWERGGRHDIPWKRLADGRRPAPGEALDPYAVLVAEVMRAARQHICLRSTGFRTRDGGKAIPHGGE